jgi:signal transduction histidine kinase
MKISDLVKIVVSTFLLLVVSTSCEKEKPVIAKRYNNTAKIKRLTIIADDYFDKFDNKNAFKLYERIIAISDPVKDRIDYVDALISIGYIYLDQGDYVQSEATVIKILPHLKYLKKPRFAWDTYNILGCSYLRTKNFDNAILYFKKAYNLNTKERRKSNALANIGLTYMHQKDYKKAIKIYSKLTSEGFLAENKKTNTLKDYELKDFAISLDNLGICYFQTNDSKSLLYFNEALKIRLETDDLDNVALSYSNLSDYYLKKNPSLAKKYAEKAYKIAREINNYQSKKYSLYSLIQCSKGSDLKKYSNLYVKFTDSITNLRINQKNQSSNIKYNSNKDKEENLLLKAQKAENELQLQKQKNRSFISYTIISLTFTILLFLYFYLTSKRKKENFKAIYESESRIAKKLHNELTNDVYQTLTLAKAKDLQQKENKEILLLHLDQIYSKTRNISKENSLIKTDRNYPQDLKEMIAGFKTSNLNILLNGFNTVPWNKIEKNKKITVYRIIQEVLLNSAKHNNPSLVSLTFKLASKKITFTYINNGAGIDHHGQILKNDLQNVENRIKTIKGTITFDNNFEKGIKISFTFPL